MSKNLKKKFKRLWAKEKQQDLWDEQGPAGDIDYYKTESKFNSIASHIKRSWVDVRGNLTRPFKRLKINESGI
ncbi:MAG: hypothetical protein ACM3NH_03635 [Candidatus Saccharibacteria bacterium]